MPWNAAPEPHEPLEVAEGIWWVRVPLPGPPGHVNCFVIDDGDSWSVLDTGLDTPEIRALWEGLLAGPFGAKPVSRIIISHHHPDHIGLAGWFEARGATLWCTRVCYLTARMLWLDEQPIPAPETIDFWTKGGMAPDILAQKQAARPFNLRDCVHPLPLGFKAIEQGDRITLGGRDWIAHLGQGHAPGLITFWSVSEPVVLASDQILPGISPNISVFVTEPDADPLGGWIESCQRLARLARPEHIVFGGHKLPFRGLSARLRQLEVNHRHALDRLEEFIATPATAADCFPVLFKRPIGEASYSLALGESLAHLAHLRAAGRARRWTDGGQWKWQAC